MVNQNDQPRVTIAIPTYNSAERFLGQAIRSAVDQTYERLEILVSDNASRDKTAELVASFDDPRLRYVRHASNIGPNANFNCCLREATGSYFLLLHDDDLIDPDFVARCVEAAQGQTSCSFVRTGTRQIDTLGSTVWQRKNIVPEREPEALFRAWFRGTTPWYFCSTLFRTSSLRALGGLHSKHNLLEDGYAIVKLARRRDWIDIPDVLASVRRTPEQRTFKTPVGEWCEDYLGLLDLMCEQVGGLGDFRANGERCFAKRCLRRAAAQPTATRRVAMALVVAHYFGFRHLRLDALNYAARWKRLLPSAAGSA